jgi:uncharacterized protein (TIRG00374 family)
MKIITNWRFWVGGVISVGCFWLALRHVPLTEVAHLVARGDLLWLTFAIILQTLAVVTRAQRWVMILDKKGRLADSFWALGVGYLFTNVFPLRMGEPARVVLMAQRSNLPVMQVAASAIVERVLDVATIVLLLVLVLPLMSVPPLVIRSGMTLGLLALSAIAVLLLTVRFQSQSERIFAGVVRRTRILPTEAIVAKWRELVAGLASFTKSRVAVQSVGWSLITWFFSVAMYWCVLRAFQPDASPVEAVFVVVALCFAVSVPSSPGFLGVFQLVGQQALVLPFGGKYEATHAMAIIMSAYLAYYLLTTILGVIGLWRLGESFANVGKLIKSRKPSSGFSVEA